MTWRILLVDDEPDVRLITRTTLEPKYEVLEAHDGLDALEKIQRYDPDFVLMDVMMPLMNGFEACSAIRSNPKFAELPVMFLSALGTKDDMMKGYSSGANLYLTKPFEPSRLLKNIDVFFERTPPPIKKRRLTIEQIREAEKSGKEPASPGSDEFIASGDTTPDTGKARPTSPEPEATALLLPRLMSVDDDMDILHVVKLTLEGICEVVTASDGMEAIEKLVKYQPDILLIDIMLPKMNGFQLCQSLRANRAFARLPIIMCSGRSTDRDVAFAKRIGADDFLPKPFIPMDLVTKIKEVQRQPGFRIRPKTFSIEQIEDMEGTKKRDVFQVDDDVRHGGKEGNNSEIKQFLIKEGKRDALEKEQTEEDDKKKKKRFFGFGG